MKPCPICGKKAVEAFAPFCSERCKTRDLANWASGAYAVPLEEAPGEEEED